MTTQHIHPLQRFQQDAIALEDKIKSFYSNKSFAKQLIAGAADAVDYSYKAERDIDWYRKYITELENRL